MKTVTIVQCSACHSIYYFRVDLLHSSKCSLLPYTSHVCACKHRVQKSFTSGNVCLLTNFLKLSAVIKKCYACSNWNSLLQCGPRRVARLAFFRVARLAFFRVARLAQKILVGLLSFFWPHLKSAGLKKCIWPFGCFLAFLRWNTFLRRKILLFHLFGNTFAKMFVINAISDGAFWY